LSASDTSSAHPIKFAAQIRKTSGEKTGRFQTSFTRDVRQAAFGSVYPEYRQKSRNTASTRKGTLEDDPDILTHITATAAAEIEKYRYTRRETNKRKEKR
jgi:hypothetical protein